MFKRIFPLLVFALTAMSFATPALAKFGLEASGQKAGYSASVDIYSTISTIIGVVLSMAGLVFLIIMFYAGFRWMTARGNDEHVTKAKDAMFAAIIGFILVVLSYGISAFVFSRLIK